MSAPTSAEAVAGLVREILAQKTSSMMTEREIETADWQGGWDMLVAQAHKLAEACEPERLVTIGWNACRKSIYAVCEDVREEADRARIKGPAGTHSEEQHAKGYHAGTCYAAKSIARGFNSMEAVDDSNVREALSKAQT